MTRLALFDLDHTLLSGDSDVLWCEFAIAERLLNRAEFEPRNQRMADRYAAGHRDAGRVLRLLRADAHRRASDAWQGLRERFLCEVIAPRIPASSRELVERHRAGGDRVVLTTATNRFLVELTARDLGIDDLLATEVEVVDGAFTGRNTGVLNMREGKVERLRRWLEGEGLPPTALADAAFYSDSKNDLPLLLAVGHPVAVDPDDVLAAHARRAGWPVLKLAR
jgi:HAD superfamily hydrolase (TIGR01490 family)